MSLHRRSRRCTNKRSNISKYPLSRPDESARSIKGEIARKCFPARRRRKSDGLSLASTFLRVVSELGKGKRAPGGERSERTKKSRHRCLHRRKGPAGAVSRFLSDYVPVNARHRGCVHTLIGGATGAGSAGTSDRQHKRGSATRGKPCATFIRRYVENR